MDEEREPTRRRGTVLLFTTIIVISSIIGAYSLPPFFSVPDLEIRVAVIDSGIDIDQELKTRVVAAKSFVNTTYGFVTDDNSTSDSSPGNSPHGTYVAKIIASEAPNVAIVNAKVVSQNDEATPRAIAEAIRWAVLEENCSVINLSLGLAPLVEDYIGHTIRWAFERGVSIVAAAGNGGDGGVAGSSIDSPAIYPEVIAVAALDEANRLYSFSSIGPLRNRLMKPEVAARGFYSDNGRTVVGTSFAAPVVSAGVTQIISHCLNNGWSWTPGMVKAAIMISAKQLPYEEWEVGAGLFDLETALLYIDSVQKPNGLPLLVAITPTESPFSFERIFINHTTLIPVSIYTSSNVTLDITYRGRNSEWIHGPQQLFVNQTGSFTVKLRVVASDSLEDLEASVSIYGAGYLFTSLSLEFDARAPHKTVAFDISHTPWAIDSSFGQFRELYYTLTKVGIAVDELRHPENISLDIFSNYDAIFLLDPCAWGYLVDHDGINFLKTSIYDYDASEIAVYETYYDQGGSLFFTALSNDSIDHQSVNDLFSAFNLTLNDDHLPVISIVINGVRNTELVTNMVEHIVTRMIESFDYNGCSLNYTGDAYELAWVEVMEQHDNGSIYPVNKTVLAGSENSNGGRFIATGSNFFLDNWALSDMYRSDQNFKIVLQSVYWLLHILNN
ncbi:MAG: S8 family serine peptidase [Candidatus Thorarchaeota archaeon]